MNIRAVGAALAPLVALSCTDGTGPRPDASVPPVTCDEGPRWIHVDPPVLDPTSSGQATITVVFPSCVPVVRLVDRSGSISQFEAVDDETAVLRLPVQRLLVDRRSGDHHVFAGYVDLSNQEGRYMRLNGFFNVRLTSMPDVSVIPMANQESLLSGNWRASDPGSHPRVRSWR